MAPELAPVNGALVTTTESDLWLDSAPAAVVSRPGAGVAFALLNSALHTALVKAALLHSEADPGLAPYVSQHVALHITLDSRRSAYGVFCGDSLTVYGEKASDIRILLPQFESIPMAERAERLLQTVAHELAHVWGHQMGIKTTSRGGRYHSKRYGRLAEALGLVTERDDRYGLRTVGFTSAAAREYADIVADINKALVVEMAASKLVPAKATAGEIVEAPLPSHISGSCGCKPARTIRMTRAQWIAGPSTCDVCHEHYLAAGSGARRQPVGVLVGAKVAGSIEKGI